MKVRLKLITSLILALIIPMIVFYIYSSSQQAEILVDDQFTSLKCITADKAAYTDEFFDNIIERIRIITADESIRQFVSDYSDGTVTEDELEYAQRLINESIKKSDNIIDMYIINNDGLIISAYNSDDSGKYFEQKEQLNTYVSNYSGISEIFPPSKGSTSYFYAVRRIYSPSNLKIGFVCQKISVERLTDQIKLSGFSNYASTLIIDSKGCYITGSVSTPKSLDSISEYKGIKEHLADAIPFYTASASEITLTADYDYFSVCGNAVSLPGWSIVSIFDRKVAKAYTDRSLSTTVLVAAVCTAVSIAAVCFIAIKFTEPVSNMMQVIKRHKKGDLFARAKPASKDENGKVIEHFNSLLDKISESEQRYDAIVSMSDQVVFEVNLKTFKVYTSYNFNQKFCFRAKDDSINESFLYKIKIHKDDAARYKSELDRIVSSTGAKWEGEYRFRNIYGDFSWIRVKGVKLFDLTNNPIKIIGTLTDIDREKKSTINLMQKANYDALTQLYNRATFLRTLDEEMLSSAARRSLDALMFIDLDDFKHFNDEFGHKCGDEVLKFVADTIKEITFDKGFGGRLGGDEFVMCLTNLKLIGDAGKAAAEVISILDNGFISESCGEKFNIHCSIGIAFFRENGDNSTVLLEAADSAMYKIKKSGKSNFAYAGRDADFIQTPDSSGLSSRATFDSTFLS